MNSLTEPQCLKSPSESRRLVIIKLIEKPNEDNQFISIGDFSIKKTIENQYEKR